MSAGQTARRRGTAGAGPAAGPSRGVVTRSVTAVDVVDFVGGAGDGCGGRSAVTVCGNEATSLESARGSGGGSRAPGRSLEVVNCNEKPRPRASGILTRSTVTLLAVSRSATRTRGELVSGRRDHDSRAPRNRMECSIQLRASDAFDSESYTA